MLNYLTFLLLLLLAQHVLTTLYPYAKFQTISVTLPISSDQFVVCDNHRMIQYISSQGEITTLTENNGEYGSAVTHNVENFTLPAYIKASDDCGTMALGYADRVVISDSSWAIPISFPYVNFSILGYPFNVSPDGSVVAIAKTPLNQGRPYIQFINKAFQ